MYWFSSGGKPMSLANGFTAGCESSFSNTSRLISKKPVPVLVTSTKLSTPSSCPGIPFTHHLMGMLFIGYKPPITSTRRFNNTNRCQGSQPMSASINIKWVLSLVCKNLAVSVFRAREIKLSLVMVSTVHSMPSCRAMLAHLI